MNKTYINVFDHFFITATVARLIKGDQFSS